MLVTNAVTFLISKLVNVIRILEHMHAQINRCEPIVTHRESPLNLKWVATVVFTCYVILANLVIAK